MSHCVYEKCEKCGGEYCARGCAYDHCTCGQKEADPTKPKWEVDDQPTGFKHRIVLGDKTGPWAPFRAIAQLDNLRCCTDYFRGDLPVGVVFKIETIK